MLIFEFNLQFHAHLDEKEETLGKLVQSHFDHLPGKGESVCIDAFVFKVKEVSVFGIKTLSVKSLQE